MKNIKVVREIFRSKMGNVDGFAVASPDGELGQFYPIRVHPAAVGCDTVEISADFFLNLAILQSQGVKVIFKP